MNGYTLKTKIKELTDDQLESIGMQIMENLGLIFVLREGRYFMTLPGTLQSLATGGDKAEVQELDGDFTVYDLCLIARKTAESGGVPEYVQGAVKLPGVLKPASN